MTTIPPLLRLRGIGPGLAARLARLDLFDLRDLLLHIPLRYEDRSKVTPIAELQEGKTTLVEGEVLTAEMVGKQKSHLVCRLVDASGALNLRFFTVYPGLRSKLLPGSRWRCYGIPRFGSYGFEMVHPELLSPEEPLGIVPVYPTTASLSQKSLRRMVEEALHHLEPAPSWLPEVPPPIFGENGLLKLPLGQALFKIHQPSSLSEIEPIRRRLAFEELLAYHIGLRQSQHHRLASRAPICRLSSELKERFLNHLPFKLTAAQKRVIEEILTDLACERPMGRLLQGDVGSGKTVVAAVAALAAWESGWQTALMVPTELLAEQHYENWQKWFALLGVKMALFTSAIKGEKRREILEGLAEGTIDIAIGTHALFQQGIHYGRLGLVIVDEQHRFGVGQRLALRLKGAGEVFPHYLVMTATPIPRTLAMLRYGDLDLSVIDELPSGRKPVETRVLPQERRDELIRRLDRWLAEGRQAYWVCTLIETSEALEAQALEEVVVELRRRLVGRTVETIHGRMKSEEKESVMRRFKAGEIDLLVGTTVIEVGVDVPNVSLMVVENAERLGLAQLHQLRGRIGRGDRQSYCILLYKPPLTNVARQRLLYIRDHHDGFAIAERDLELRGPGEVLGTRQSGELRFKIADLSRDRDLLPAVAQAAERLDQTLDPRQKEIFLRFWLRDGFFYGKV